MIRPSGADYVITGEDEVLDAICAAVYGKESMVVSVLEANPGLSALGPVLPSGVRIALPPAPAPKTIATIRLWD